MGGPGAEGLQRGAQGSQLLAGLPCSPVGSVVWGEGQGRQGEEPCPGSPGSGAGGSPTPLYFADS